MRAKQVWNNFEDRKNSWSGKKYPALSMFLADKTSTTRISPQGTPQSSGFSPNGHSISRIYSRIHSPMSRKDSIHSKTSKINWFSSKRPRKKIGSFASSTKNINRSRLNSMKSSIVIQVSLPRFSWLNKNSLFQTYVVIQILESCARRLMQCWLPSWWSTLRFWSITCYGLAARSLQTKESKTSIWSFSEWVTSYEQSSSAVRVHLLTC